MKEGLHFYYDGIYSMDMGLYNINIGTGFLEEPFVAEKEIKEIKIRGREKPYFQEVERKPLVFTFSFAFKDYYDEEKIREVARWLDQDYYKPFYTTDNPNRILMCMLNGDSSLLHNALKQGYVTVEMRCDSPYSYSPEIVTQIFDWSNYKGHEIINQTSQNDFGNWNHNNTIADANGDLILNSVKTKWGDISNGAKWGDL